MGGGLIAGRSPNLWLGAFVAVWNVAAIVFHLDANLVQGVDLAAGAVIVLVAGSDTIQLAAGAAASARRAVDAPWSPPVPPPTKPS